MQIYVQLHAGTRTLVLPLPLYRTMRLSYRAWLRLTVLDRRCTLLELMPKQAPACPLADLGSRVGDAEGSASPCCLGTTAPAPLPEGARETAGLSPAALHASEPAAARAEMAPSRKGLIQVYALVQAHQRLHIPEAIAAATGIDPGAWLRFTLLPDRSALVESVTAAAVVALGAAGFASTRR